MGCELSCCVRDDASQEEPTGDGWKESIGGCMIERWIVPERVLLLRDLQHELKILKRHGDKLSAVHELHMLVRSMQGFNPSLSGPFIMYDYVPGPDMFEYVVNRGASSTCNAARESLKLCIAIGNAIDNLHENGMCHFDIKPENIVLRNNNPELPVLIDFEFAHHDRAWKLDKTYAIDIHRSKGTPGYCAPEVLEHAFGGPPSDVWSFGIVLFFVMNRKHLCLDRSKYNTLIRALKWDPLAFRKHVAEEWPSTSFYRQYIDVFTLPFNATPKRRPTMYALIRQLLTLL